MSAVYEYACDRVVPGCTVKITGDTPERVREKAREHLREHHGMEYVDQPKTDVLDLAVVMMR
jgi:predicted small metal-binding protein